MSALAEALVAAQRRALSAMEKQYAAGRLDADDARALMDGIGVTDAVDQDRLIAALDVIRDYGAQLPAETNGATSREAAGTEPATGAQLALVERLVKEKHVTGPDLPITKAQAHEIIDSLKAGSYDPAKWTVPF
jgi:hypothetical protein